jgi:hypothetical protein
MWNFDMVDSGNLNKLLLSLVSQQHHHWMTYAIESTIIYVVESSFATPNRHPYHLITSWRPTSRHWPNWLYLVTCGHRRWHTHLVAPPFQIIHCRQHVAVPTIPLGSKDVVYYLALTCDPYLLIFYLPPIEPPPLCWRYLWLGLVLPLWQATSMPT